MILVEHGGRQKRNETVNGNLGWILFGEKKSELSKVISLVKQNTLQEGESARTLKK